MPQRKGIYAAAIGFAASAALTTLYQPTASAHSASGANPDKSKAGIHLSHLDGMAPKITIKLPKSGSTKQFKGSITFINDTDQKVTLRLKRTIRISNSNAPRELTLAKGASKKVSLTGSLNASNGYTAAGIIYNSSTGGQSTDLVSIQVKDGQFITLRTGDFSLNSKGGKAISVSRQTRIGPGIQGFRQASKGGKTLGSLKNNMRGKSRKKAAIEPSTKELNTTSKSQSWLGAILSQTASTISKNIDDILSVFTPAATAANGTYKGRFVFRTIDASNVTLPAPGVAIRAVAEGQDCLRGASLGTTRTDGNGNFSLPINTPGSYKICYLLTSNFLNIGSRHNNIYGWSETLSNISNDRIVRRPVRHDGAMDIWYEAMTMQSSMQQAGINPVRGGAQKIKVKFPSDSTDICPDWSCADPNGQTYMFRGHATRYGTMAHELAHQIDFKYRNFKTLNEMGAGLPGAGGSHSFRNCYNPTGSSGFGAGGIVSEGWANYEMARALGSRNGSQFRGDFRGDQSGNIDNKNMDSNGTDCSGVPGSGINGSESVVTTVLWDFFDTRNDGSDTLHYVNPYYITNMYLSNNPRTAQQLHSRIHSDCIARNNSEATNNGRTCKNIFAQNGGSD